jgi:hypothetical protein
METYKQVKERQTFYIVGGIPSLGSQKEKHDKQSKNEKQNTLTLLIV